MRSGLLFILCLCFATLLHAQEPLDKSRWSDLKEQLDYSKSNTKKKNSSKADGNSGGGDEKFDSNDSSTSGPMINLGPLMQVIIIVLFIIFLVALLFAIFSNVSFQKGQGKIQTDGNDAITDIEENFTRQNLEKWLRYAYEQNDYYLVLRIQFLMILKSLELQRLILWKKNKTNWDYINELSSHHFQVEFQQLVNDFDQVWYGEKSYSEDMLREKISHFESFKEMISKK